MFASFGCSTLKLKTGPAPKRNARAKSWRLTLIGSGSATLISSAGMGIVPAAPFVAVDADLIWPPSSRRSLPPDAPARSTSCDFCCGRLPVARERENDQRARWRGLRPMAVNSLAILIGFDYCAYSSSIGAELSGNLQSGRLAQRFSRFTV